MTPLFPLGWEHYLVGGLLVGAGTSLIYVLTGITAGASSVFSAAWSWLSAVPFFNTDSYRESRVWRVVFAASMVVGALVFATWQHAYFVTDVQYWRLLLGGFLVGVGTRTARGCTSGHGICGLASFSVASLVSVVTFLVIAVSTALLVQAVGVAP
jgi:hypothetical protein